MPQVTNYHPGPPTSEKRLFLQVPVSNSCGLKPIHSCLDFRSRLRSLAVVQTGNRPLIT